MKKKIQFALMMILCVALGFCIGIGIVRLMKGEDVGGSIDGMKLAWSLLLSLCAMVVAFLVNIILHEAGHLACGLLTGYKFLSFRFWNITLQREDDGWHWKRYDIAGTVGQCLMSPPDKAEMPYFWYNAGGVLANLIICAISGALLYFCELSAVPRMLCVMLLITGGYLFAVNAIPMNIGGVPNDGMNILILSRHADQRKYFRNMLSVVASQSRGTRLSEMPEEWFEAKPTTKESTTMEISARNLQYARHIDQLRFDEAKIITEEIATSGNTMPALFSMELACDRLLLELVTSNRAEIINELWNEKYGQLVLSDYIKKYSQYFPLKCATLFAYELIHNSNQEAAQKYYEEVKAKQDTYTQKGEALEALEIMDRIKKAEYDKDTTTGASHDKL